MDHTEPSIFPQNDNDFPFASVIVPAYNEQLIIGVCIEALLAQDYPRDRFEIIVVDNNSTDDTARVISGYEVILGHERSMQSSYASRNTGIRLARGEIIAFTDADCIAEPDWLRRLVAPFADETVGGVGGQVKEYQATNLVEKFIQRHLPYKHCDQSDGRLLSGLITTNAAYRRDDLLQANLFNTMFDCSDIDLTWRLQLLSGKRISFVPDAVVHHKHRSCVKSLFWWQYRFGFGQVLMSSLYRGRGDSFYNPEFQLKSITKQMVALLVYVCSFIYRSFLQLFENPKAEDPLFLATPVLFFVADSGLLVGRLKGLWETRLFSSDVSNQTWEEPVKRHQEVR